MRSPENDDAGDRCRTKRSPIGSARRSVGEGRLAGRTLTEEEIKSFLDMEPDFLETAKSMLREFFERTKNYRRDKN